MNGILVGERTALRAAREDRGVALVVAARASGLLLSQAEALENGDVTSFSSADEMMAAAGAYADCLGIPRNELVTILDSTVSNGSLGSFSAAVRARSEVAEAGAGVIEAPSAAVQPESIPLAPFQLAPDAPPLTAGPVIDAPVESFNAAEATGEIPAIQPAGELESWVRTNESASTSAWSSSARVKVDQLVGIDRTEAVARAFASVVGSASRVVSSIRERMRSNEHATLVVALMGGLILLATLLAIGSAMDTNEPTQTSATAEQGQGPLPPTMDPNRGQMEEKGVSSQAADAQKTAAKKAPAKPAVVAQLAPGQITVNVLNAGRVKGRAAEVASDLRAKGYKVGKVENSKTSYSVPVVLIPTELQREAQRIMRVSGITTMDTVAQGGSAKTVTVVVK